MAGTIGTADRLRVFQVQSLRYKVQHVTEFFHVAHLFLLLRKSSSEDIHVVNCKL